MVLEEQFQSESLFAEVDKLQENTLSFLSGPSKGQEMEVKGQSFHLEEVEDYWFFMRALELCSLKHCPEGHFSRT